jgi:hypothetical protein
MIMSVSKVFDGVLEYICSTNFPLLPVRRVKIMPIQRRYTPG